MSSPVLKWPDAERVIAAARAWAKESAERHPEIRRIGCFGSYARGDAGVGSDLDVVVVVSESDRPFLERAATYDATTLPVPAELLVYTQAEWAELMERTDRFARTLQRETVWLWSG